MKNSLASMQNRIRPVSISLMLSGRALWVRVLMVDAPLVSTARSMEINTIPIGLSWASQATVIPVKPTPPATESDRV